MRSLFKSFFLKKNFSGALLLSFILGSGISFNKIRLYHLVSILSLFSFTEILKIHKCKISLDKKITIPFLIFFFFSILSFMWSQSLRGYIQFNFCLMNGLYLAIYLFLKTTKNNLENLLKPVFYLLTITFIFAFLESLRLFHFPFNSTYLDFLDFRNNSSQLSSDALYYLTTLPSAYFWNTNDLMAFAVMSFPTAIILKDIKPLFKYVIAAFFLVILYMNGSQICTLATVLMGILACLSKKVQVSHKKIFALVSISAILFIILPSEILRGKLKAQRLNALPASIEVYLGLKERNQLNFVPTSTDKRKELVLNGFAKFKEHPFIGNGAGNDLVAWRQYSAQTNIHNFWLELLVQFGIVGFVFFCTSYFLLFRKVFLDRKKSELNFTIFITLLFQPVILLSLSGAIYQPALWVPITLSIISLKEN